MKIAENVSLWMIHFMSSYYDNDARMPGTVPIDERIVVIALSYDDALEKAEPLLKKLRKKHKKNNHLTLKQTIWQKTEQCPKQPT